MNLERFRGASALFGAAFIYSTFGILIRQMALMFGDSAQTAARFAVAFVFVLFLNLIRRQSFSLPKKSLIKSCLLGVFFGAEVLLFTVSVNNTKIANSVFLLYAASMISSFMIGTLWFKEKLTLTKITAIIIAFVGLYMYSDAIFVMSMGIVAGIASGILDGVSNALRKTLKDVKRNAVLTYQFIFSSLFACLAMIFSGEVMVKEIVFVSMLAVVIFAVFQIALNNLLLYGFQHFDVNIGTVILATELLFAAIIGFLFFKEIPTIKEVIGGGLIFIASVISVLNIKNIFAKKHTR